MGTTIRRQPVSFDIPDAPDYKFLNITNFGGLQKSSNPFVVSSNTASDCLNVYVDEDNALSTRPRLQSQANLLSVTMNNTTAPITTAGFNIIGVYNLHDGYLLHGVENNTAYMFKLKESNDTITSVTTISGADTIKNKCKIFEQNDKIYVLDGIMYRNIIGSKISAVEGYVPTTTIGRWKASSTKNDDGTVSVSYAKSGSTYESLNVLSQKYKETYFWDGAWDIESIRLSSEDLIENNYVVETRQGFKGEDWITGGNTRIHKYLRTLSDEDEEKNYFAVQNDLFDDSWYAIVSTDKDMNFNENDIKSIPFSPTSDWDYFNMYCSDDGTTVVMAMYYYGGEYNKLNIYRRSDKYSSTFTAHEITVPAQEAYGYVNIETVLVNKDGTRIIYIDSESRGHLLKYNGSAYTDTLISDQYKVTHIDMDVNGKWVVCELKEHQNQMEVDKFVKFDAQADSITLIDIPGVLSEATNECSTGLGFKISPSGKSLIVAADTRTTDNYTRLNSRLLYFADLTSTDAPVELESTISAMWREDTVFVFDDYEQTVYYHTAYTPTKGGWINLATKSIQKNVLFPAIIENYPYVEGSKIVATDAYTIVTNSLDLESVEPLLIVTRNVNTLERDVLKSLNEQRAKFNQSTLVSRFDNNTWFASKNSTFYTQYNDPTYIPLSSYNDLGEEYEPITGLSVVNDNILAAYKRNRIYIITPITVGNELTYSYTETKNIIGNDVVDAPTLTILTEMPIIVSYNGIYALNQLENVQSSDRITTLISEAVNPNWLKERKDDVDRCLTLNRLYWTYFILPHKKVSNALVKDNDYTRIYLLDNRTQSWFYWELPIYVISAMVKNNKTHFVNEKGELYTLEITDLINKYNPDVTEYYDNLKKPVIIPWHWTSQILSLNTINYAKRLIDTTFVVTDTDMSDEYALNYKFKAFRKNKNAETTELTLTNDIEFVESITKRTMIPRFNFIQLTLSNTEDDLNNNKLRLVGLGLKYVLLGGLY